MYEIERMRPSWTTRRRLSALRRFMFVTCAREDDEKTKPLFDLIERDGHVLWIDHAHAPSEANPAKDLAAILGACQAVLALCSAASYASKPARREIEMAYRLGKPIVPVALDGASMPDVFAFYLARWPIIRLDDPHWKVRLRSATEAVARGKRRWQGSPPVSTECVPVLVVS